jgi:hypothetical protein
MDPDKSIHCERDTKGELWRIQCDPVTKVCLYSPNSELDTAGNRAKPLERARPCPVKRTFDRAAMISAGYKLVEGRPDAPHGWTRDERGRVFQVNFDLLRRMYLGASYSPKLQIEGEKDSGRSAIDFGLLVFEHFGGPRNPTRHRIRAVEGRVHLAPFAADMVLLHYDLSRRFLDPLLRVTTFFGSPKRYDLNFNLGLWTDVGSFEAHHDDGGDATLWKFGVAQVAFDLWQSEKLDSFVRLRTGGGIERLYTDTIGDRSAVTLSSAFDMRLVVDQSGFHNINVNLTHETPRYFIPSPTTGRWARRMEARVEYEAILLAINDQPVSIALGAGAERRDDLPTVPDEWAFVANTGLRFSLWAPPRPR